MTRSVEPSHLSGVRIPIPGLVESMTVNRAVSSPAPSSIAIFDDILTTGRHFKALQSVLRSTFGDIPVVGIFIARRAAESSPI